MDRDSSCYGKITFTSRAVAERVARRRRRAKNKGLQTQQVYRCPFCRKWHQGRAKQ